MRIIFITIFISLLAASCGNNKRKQENEAKKKELQEKLNTLVGKEYDSVEQIIPDIQKTLGPDSLDLK